MTRRPPFRSIFLIGLGVVVFLIPAGWFAASALVMDQESAAPRLTLLPGWPVTVKGGSRFSPPILRAPDGTRFLLHNQQPLLAFDPAPWVVARDHLGLTLSGWPPLTAGLPLRGASVWQDQERRARQIYVAGIRIHGIQVSGAPVPGWPVPDERLPNGLNFFRAPPSLGDLDGDGIPEVLAADDSGGLFVWRADGRPYPGWSQQLPDPENIFQGKTILAPPAASDLDGDGLPEFIVASQSGIVAVYDRFGKIRDGWPQDMTLVATTGSEFAIVPFDDGTSGVAISTETPARVSLFRHTGDLAPGWPRRLQGFRARGVAAGDLDGDGMPELIVGDNEKLWAFHLDGSAVEGWPVDAEFGMNHEQPLIADITGDGYADVLLSLFSTGTWVMGAWEADGTSLRILQPFSSGWIAAQAPTLGDLDGDGLLDLTIAMENAGSIFAPGRVAAFTLNVPVAEASMHWPTPSHDYARSSTWSPPTNLYGGGGRVVPGTLREASSGVVFTVHLDVPAGAPVEEGLAVTALAGLKIPPVPLRLLAKPRSAPAGRTRVIAQLSEREILRPLSELLEDHPEIFLTDDETRNWLETGIVPPIPPSESRTLWLTIESPRVGLDKLKAHVPVQVVPAL